jgi:hypothetical protein
VTRGEHCAPPVEDGKKIKREKIKIYVLGIK